MVSGESTEEEQLMIRSVRKLILTGTAFTSLGLGIAGIFLPLLPTAPFILLAAFCFLKSSHARYEWLAGHRIFGGYISDYINNGSMPLRAKIISILLMWAAMTVSALIVSKALVSVLLVLIGIAVSVHILSLRTLRKSKRHIDPVDEHTQ